ncbi:MAG: S8 family serine peptidase [Bacteroides sp.]|nr:S8 family serine peptidase [Bacteroides sp.]
MKRLSNYSSLIALLTTIILVSCDDTILDESFSDKTNISRSSATEQLCDSVEYNSSYYWFEDEKIPLHKIKGKYLVMYKPSNQDKIRKKSLGFNMKFKEVIDARGYVYKFKEKTSQRNRLENLELIMATVEVTSENIDSVMSDSYYYAPYYLLDDGTEVGVRNTFYVKLKSDSDLPRLKEFADKYCVYITDETKSSDRWYTLSCSKYSKNNALELANIFHESGCFEFSCPELFGLGHLDEINEPLYASGALWHLGNNPSYSYIHINYDNARRIISEGSPDVIVAVIDTGVDGNHRDLPNVLSGWDADTETSPNKVYHYHGTMVAGFIGATPNNGQDVAGVGYGATILPISINTTSSGIFITNAEDIANAIRYAADYGANVINCSWRYGRNQDVSDAFTYALNKGCIVVAASGNNNGNVSYPANSNSRIIAVGAIDKNGNRASFSNYGESLTVVAPGVDVYSTSPNNSVMMNSGTSFAAPQVSGLAAMILSKYPNETSVDVRNRIIRTAIKINSSTYKYDYRIKNDIQSSNLKWNKEMGYGLIDAAAALAPEMPYPLTIRIKNSSGYMPMAAFRIEITTPNFEPLSQYPNEIGVVLSGEEFSARYNITPGNYNVYIYVETTGIDLDYLFTTELGGEMSFEYTGNTFDTLGWSTPTFKPYTWISNY